MPIDSDWLRLKARLDKLGPGQYRRTILRNCYLITGYNHASDILTAWGV